MDAGTMEKPVVSLFPHRSLHSNPSRRENMRARSKPLFELNSQWIAEITGSPNLYRCWTDPRTGRSCRASLGTADLELAKKRFAEAVFREDSPKTPEARLATVLENYFVHHSDKRPSGKNQRVAGKLLLQFFGDTVCVKDITEAEQKRFAVASLAKGNALAYVSRNLSVLSAAVRRAEIPIRIWFSEAQIEERWSLITKAARRTFVPTDLQLASLLTFPDLPQDFFRWAVMALLTAGRSEAAWQLTPAQRDREASLIDLNPAWRRQIKRKYRPKVRMPASLGVMMDSWEAQMRIESAKRQLTTPDKVDISGERYCSYTSLAGVRSALRRPNQDLGLRLSRRSFRHKAATVMRAAGVSEDEIAIQMGHKREGLQVTAGYGEWSPNYCANATMALETWWQNLERLMPASAVSIRKQSASA